MFTGVARTAVKMMDNYSLLKHTGQEYDTAVIANKEGKTPMTKLVMSAIEHNCKVDNIIAVVFTAGLLLASADSLKLTSK